jgi:hypothetical protein
MEFDEATLFPWAVKRTYRQVFYLMPYATEERLVVPSFTVSRGTVAGTFIVGTVPPVSRDAWRVDTSWVEGFYSAAKYVIEGVAAYHLHEGLEGIPGVFLFRHYLELVLKNIVFHARWLKDRNTNALDDEIQSIGGNHSLDYWWKEALRECSSGKIEKSVRKSYDLDFVGQCIAEFHEYDPNGETFRYHGPRFEVSKGQSTITHDLRVDYQSLLNDMEHCKEVLDAMDSYLRETYGQNEEWQDILNSY